MTTNTNKDKKKTDKWIHERIEYYLKEKGVSPELKYWKAHKEKDPKTNTSLNNLFQLASTRDFFGHKKWSKYIEEHHEICDVKGPFHTTNKQKIWTDEEIHAAIREGLDTGILTQAEWLKHPILKHHFIRAKNRRVKGTIFFGKGSWSAYRKKYHPEYV